ncbi:hypothetical protein RvY_08476 [Ramazzottius varieornatus]|uniref:G-protein coupled receptors family 1 profile domain-containing protein n=1 Tax=Ramazzottius varieornatus TaxID=947166 RepID=A0A1D1VE09_RAMVA|nr:hypothetical protein RvY_08476 [Ramazzottius varieornatus]
MHGSAAGQNFSTSFANVSFRALHDHSIPHPFAYWNLRTAYGATSKLIALLVNTFLVYLFLRHRPVRTSFNVYVVNLCISNMVYLWIYYPVSLLNEWTLYILKPKAACVFLRYMIYTFGGLIVNSHFLIALNRLWAVAVPVSYRNYHKANSLARPAMVCIIMWVLVNIVNLPSVVIDSLQPQGPNEYTQCSKNVRGPLW